MPDIDVEIAYLARSEHRLADPAEDVTGLAVIDRNGLRLGTVEHVVIDTGERRDHLLSIVSGGILGLAATRALVPVEMIAKVDYRVHLDRTREQLHALTSRQADRQTTLRREYRSPDAEPSLREQHENLRIES